MPYFDEVFVKNPSTALLEPLISKLPSTVTSPRMVIVAFESAIDALPLRTMTLSFSIASLNTDYGMPYFDEVFVKNPSTALLEDRVRTEILTVEGVKSVEMICKSPSSLSLKSFILPPCKIARYLACNLPYFSVDK
mgnify:CR=1 FL=1